MMSRRGPSFDRLYNSLVNPASTPFGWCFSSSFHPFRLFLLPDLPLRKLSLSLEWLAGLPLPLIRPSFTISVQVCMYSVRRPMDAPLLAWHRGTSSFVRHAAYPHRKLTGPEMKETVV
ncbi:hypothetical protein BJX70DRAFT_126020 [Aspergillus crustosus]